MAEPLRPLSVGEILDRTFSLYRQNFVLLVGVAILGPVALVAARLALALTGFGGSNATALIANPATVGGTLGIGMIFYMVGHAISIAATTRAVAAVYLGRPITIAESFLSLRGRLGRVLGVIFSALAIGAAGAGLLVGLGSAVMAASVASSRAESRLLMIVGLFIGTAALITCVIAGIGFAVRYALSVQACVVEDLGVRASLARSTALTRNARRRLITVIFVCTTLVYVLTVIFRIGAFLVPVGTNVSSREIVAQLFSLVAGALGAPLVTTAMSLVYYDERVRKEGFDLQLLMESLDAQQPSHTTEATPTLG